ncbi:MAG: hypothetical protein A4E52_00594 [Pelotomaculum sp. PtaB.Bin013]|nr:MAG: hypothetical protein A4E52_00594 [Pelotomaculum sp. PtaB.Bin013]
MLDLTSLLYVIVPLLLFFIVVRVFKGLIKFIIMALIVVGCIWLYIRYGYKLPINI